VTDSFDRLKSALADRYSIERELGAGGMATVYLAQDLKHRRQVAIKVLDPDLARALGSERFLREVEVTANLNHPHIIPLHDSGEADGFLFYVMPHIEGETLRERIDREGQLPLDDALQITKEVAAALSYAHSHDVIHRDVKPENVLLSAGEAVVADFGIARAITEAGGEHLTETGISIGTPAYMSPEQASGTQKLDGRSDVYALGCVLYEMLAGEPPYTGPTAQAVLAKKLSEPTPRVSVVRERVPPRVEAAIDHALAKAPADRFGTASAFAEALTAELVVARVGKRRWPRSVAAVTAAVVVLLAAWALFTRGGGPGYERLAVLPPANLMNDPAQAYFVQGMHNALISELQKVGVKVIGRTSVLQYENTQKPIREIATELGVDALVEASVLRAGDSVEIEVRLVDGTTQQAVADPIVRRSDLRDIERLYRGLTAAIAAEIQLALTPQAEAHLARARTVDPQAYDDYLRGMFHVARLMPGDFDAALGYFERALERDSTYALAYAGIAWVWIGRAQGFAQGGFESIRQAQAHASAAVRKALTLDSTLAEVQSAAGTVRTFHEWDWTGGDAAYRKAIQINPNDPLTRAAYSHFLYVTGRPTEGRAQIDRALALDSANGFYRAFNGMAYFFERRYDDAVAELNRALELGNAGGMNIIDALYLKGARAEALAALREFYAGDQEMLEAVNRGYADGGYRAALRRAADVWGSRPATFMASSFMAATWYALAEDRERTLDWLERAYEAHDSNIPYIGVLPHFDLVRDDPRFKDLLRRAGLPQ